MAMASKPRKTSMPIATDALPGRPAPMAVPPRHFVNGNRLAPPFPAGLEVALFGMGCFWGVERLFWELPGVWSTSVGYAGGFTPNPSYAEVCTGDTGHTEVVRVVFDPAKIRYSDLLKSFWESGRLPDGNVVKIGATPANGDIRRRVPVEKVHAEAVGAEHRLDAHESLRARADNQGSRHYAAVGRGLDGHHVQSPAQN